MCFLTIVIQNILGIYLPWSFKRDRNSIKVNEKCLNIYYTDDVLIFTNNIIELKYLVDRVVECQWEILLDSKYKENEIYDSIKEL